MTKVCLSKYERMNGVDMVAQEASFRCSVRNETRKELKVKTKKENDLAHSERCVFHPQLFRLYKTRMNAH
jgi:hypothetical protein